jgi:hypothetical protein
MYFSYDPQSLANLYPLYAEDVWDIIRMNRNGEKPSSLKDDASPVAPEFVTAVGDDAINRFDEARKRKKKKKSRSGKGGGQNNQSAQSAGQEGQSAGQGTKEPQNAKGGHEGKGGRGGRGGRGGHGHGHGNKPKNTEKKS